MGVTVLVANMLPYFSTNNSAYRRRADTQLCCYVRLTPIILSNATYEFVIEFSVRSGFASAKCAVKQLVRLVLFRCHPMQIDQTSVQWVSVFMRALCTLSTLTYKSVKNQVMHKPRATFLLSVSSKIDDRVTPTQGLCAKHFTWQPSEAASFVNIVGVSFNAPHIRYRVPDSVTDTGEPCFIMHKPLYIGGSLC